MENEALDGGILVDTDYLYMVMRDCPELVDEGGGLTDDQFDAVVDQIVRDAVDGGSLRREVRDAVQGSHIWGLLSDMVDDVVWDYVREHAKLARAELGIPSPDDLGARWHGETHAGGGLPR